MTLDHRGFEVHGEAGAAMRESVGGDGRLDRAAGPLPERRLIREACRAAFPEIGIRAWSWEST